MDRRDHSVNVVVSHVGKLLPSLEELASIEFGCKHPAKAKCIRCHPDGDRRRGLVQLAVMPWSTRVWYSVLGGGQRRRGQLFGIWSAPSSRVGLIN